MSAEHIELMEKDVITKDLETVKLRQCRKAELMKTVTNIMERYDIGIRMAALVMHLRDIAAADDISLERAAEMLRPTLECELDFALETLTEGETQ